MVNIKKVKMSKHVISEIAKVDSEFYTDFDFGGLSWYLQRYSEQNDIFVLSAHEKIVGYFLFLEISKALFDDICNLKYDGDYDFPLSELNCKSGYYYMPSLVVKKEYRKYSQILIKHLLECIRKIDNLVVITVSKEGHRMAEKLLKYLGLANKEKDIRVYAKR